MEDTGSKELAPGYTTSKWQIDSNAGQSGSRIRLLNIALLKSLEVSMFLRASELGEYLNSGFQVRFSQYQFYNISYLKCPFIKEQRKKNSNLL